MKRKALFCIVIVALFLFFPRSVHAMEWNEQDETTYEEFLELAKKQQPAQVAAEALMNLFAKSEDGQLIYPEYYGGCYINDKNILVIRVVDGNDYYESIIKNIMPEGAAYEFEEADISKNQLLNILSEVGEKYYNSRIDVNVTSIGLSEKKGKVVIRINENTNVRNADLIKREIENCFGTVYDDFIEYKIDSAGINSIQANVMGGTTIFRYDGNNTFRLIRNYIRKRMWN